MPRLHKYRERNASYVLTAIRGAVITYQLTPDGERKLTAAGILPGQQFQRALLLDLYRTGDTFTHGSGVDDPTLVNQLEMDFANDPDPETAFPACDVLPERKRPPSHAHWQSGGPRRPAPMRHLPRRSCR